MAADKKKYKALRVTQLDANSLTNEAFSILRQNICAGLLIHPLDRLLRFQQEIDLFLSFLIWQYTVKTQNATVGQGKYKMRYNDDNTTSKLTGNNKMWLFMLNSLPHWFLSRYTKVIKFLPVGNRNDAEKIVEKLTLVIELASLLNYVLFIRNGSYLHLPQRIFAWDCVYVTKPAPRYIDFAYHRKELVWAAVTDTSLCIAPLINFTKVYNFSRNFLKRVGLLISQKTVVDAQLCCVCEEMATNVYLSECDHTFCWYCISANLMADANYQCPVCSATLKSVLDVNAN